MKQNDKNEKTPCLPCSRRALLQAGVALAAAPWPAGCLPRLYYRAKVGDGKLVVPAQELDQLRRPEDVLVVRAEGFKPLIAVRRTGKGSGGEALTAVVSDCTHRGCRLEPEPEGYFCPCHGSRFDRGGLVIEGPATVSLTRLTLALRPDRSLQIEIPR